MSLITGPNITGGKGPFTAAISASTLPVGTLIAVSDRALVASGPDEADGSYDFTATVTDTATGRQLVSAQSVTVGATGPTDPYFANVVLLIDVSDEADASTTFTDFSSYARTPSRVNGITVVGGEIVPGVAKDASLEFASSVDFNIRQEFTLEFDLTPTSSSFDNYFLGRGTGGGGGSVSSTIFGLGSNQLGCDDATAGALTVNTKYRVCWTRNSSDTCYLFLNGVLISSATFTNTNLTTKIFDVCQLPERPDLNSLPGKINNIRLTQGVCRYTASYTPETTFPRSGP